MKARFLLIGFFLALWLCNCSGDRFAGGSAETENAILARIFPVDSLLSPWNRPPGLPTVATLRLDSTHLPFQEMDAQGLDLDLRERDGARLPFEITHWDRSRAQGRVQIRVDTALRKKGSGIELWRGLSRIDRSNPLGLWPGIADSLRVNLISVLVDDFESGTNRNRLLNNAAWFLATGSGTVAANGGRPGNALRLISSDSVPVVLAAALLTATARPLGSIDSIVVWARGTGRLRIALEHATPGSQLVAWAPHQVDSAWHRVRIRPAAFDSVATSLGGSTPAAARWSEIMDSVTHLSFWLDGPGEVWVDDPRLFGIDRDDL